MLSFQEIKESLFDVIESLFGLRVGVSVRNAYTRLFNGKVDEQGMYVLQKGNKGGEKYYILRYQTVVMGLAAVMRDVLFIDYAAKKKGYKVIVDFASDGCLLNGEKVDNLWEAFFVQSPTLNEVIANKNNTIVVSPINSRGLSDKEFMMKLTGQDDDVVFFLPSVEGKKYREKLRKVAHRYLRINDRLKKEYDKEHEAFQSVVAGKRVVGVLMREAFSDECLKYIKNKEHVKVLDYHPRVPGIDDVIDKIDQMIKQYEINTVFVASLYEETIQRFVEHFGKGNVYFINRKRINSYSLDDNDGYFSEKIPFDILSRTGGVGVNRQALFERTNTYLKELYLLSQCDYLLSPKCGGGFVAPLLREEEFDGIFYMEQSNENCLFK